MWKRAWTLPKAAWWFRRTRTTDALRTSGKLASAAPAAGTNVVIVSHKPNIIDAFGKDWFEIKEGEATIVKARDGAAYRVVARV